MAKNLPTINLASQKDESSYNSFLGWALGIGKFIVIITEVIALAAFIYRFSLDKQITDLHSEITSLELVTQSYGDSEKKFRNLQSRLSFASTYLKNENSTAKIIFDVEALFPSNVSLNTISFTPTSVKVEALAPSTDSLKSLTTAFQASPDFSSVSLDQLENNPANGSIDANYTLTLK